MVAAALLECTAAHPERVEGLSGSWFVKLTTSGNRF